MTQAYARMAKQAMGALIPFATTYLCESGLSALIAIKTKSRNQLDVFFPDSLLVIKIVLRSNIK